MCSHQPQCPSADSSVSSVSSDPTDRTDSSDRDAAHIVAFHPEQGWNLLCDGAIVFDDTGAILPDGTIVAPSRNRLAVAA